MATYQLFKLASENFPRISTTTSQAVHAYFHTMSVTQALTGGVAYSITVAKWVTGSGTTVASFATGQGYNSLCVNGVLQQSGLYSVGSTSVTITPTSATTLHKGYVITLQTYNSKTAITVSAHVSSLIAVP